MQCWSYFFLTSINFSKNFFKNCSCNVGPIFFDEHQLFQNLLMQCWLIFFDEHQLFQNPFQKLLMQCWSYFFLTSTNFFKTCSCNVDLIFLWTIVYFVLKSRLSLFVCVFCGSCRRR